jgi:hypothetical protein
MAIPGNIALACEIREYYIPGDFQNWKDHDAFEAAFTKLLSALRASEGEGERNGDVASK